MLALPIFPGSYPPSIVGADELNFCVRDGNRWTLIAINTNYLFMSSAPAENIFYYNALFLFVKGFLGDPCGNRTHVYGVRGRRLSRLTNGPWCAFTDSNRGPTD